METLTIKIKDKERLKFIYEILSHFDFVELPERVFSKHSKNEHDFFSSAGLWQDRDISIKSLRNKAWEKD